MGVAKAVSLLIGGLGGLQGDIAKLCSQSVVKK
jgi:hypothetical protein